MRSRHCNRAVPPLSEMAVLVRTGFQMREFEERFITLGLPYRVVGGPRFYERQEIRDAIAYLRVVHQPEDDLAFERIVNVPRRGLGTATLNAVHFLARAQGIALGEAAARLVATDELKPQARSSLSRLVADFDRWRGLAQTVDQVELAETVLDESGYTGMWQNDKSPDAPGRLENLKELVAALAEFENLGGFLEHVSLVMDIDMTADGAMVSLMTLHSAKGLEFDHVFLAGWEEGLLPHQRSLDEGGTGRLEEERRLAHVGVTRARKGLMVSFAANRRIYNQWQSSLPSRFIDELPPEHIETLSDAGLYGARGFPGAAMAEGEGGWESVGRGPGFRRMLDGAGRGRDRRSDAVIDGKVRRLAGSEGEERRPRHRHPGVPSKIRIRHRDPHRR